MKLKNITSKSLEVREQYLELIGYMARIDGDLHKTELALWQKMMDKFAIPDKRKEKIFAVQKITEEEIDSRYNVLKENQLHYSFLVDLLTMALADNVIMDAERLMLSRIGKLIGIPHDEFHNLINFAQAITGIDINETIDPMYSYVIEMFFQWIKKEKITIYQQTTLAINEQVDEYLKNKLLAAV